MAQYYGSPRWTAEVADCSMPMTFDTYSNCAFGCMYCFAQYSRAVGAARDAYLAKQVHPVNVERVKNMFLHPDECAGSFAPYIKARKVMQWGGMSDQFDGFERKYGVTLQLLKFFKEIDYPLCFSTKAAWFTQDARYMDLIRGQKNWNFKFSVITLDEEKARIIERGVPTPMERLAAIQRIAEADAGGATLRLRPFIIGVSTPTYLDLIDEAARHGATALSTEFFCVEQRSNNLKQYMPELSRLCGFDVMAFYKKYSYSAGYLRLNRKVKEPFIMNMKEACERNGLRFYVSDAHFKELCANGSCCGLPPTWNYSHGQFCEALVLCRKNGSVRYSEIRRDADLVLCEQSCTCLNMGSSENRARFRGMSLADHQRWLWNNPMQGQSPYKMFEGVMTPSGTDENGDLVYYYTPKK